MTILISVLSIFVITTLVISLQRLLPFSKCVMMLCAICAGVALTWIGLLAAFFLGYPVDIRVPAILMGGSIVGIAYQAGKFLPITRSEFLWKSIFIPIGFALVFTVLDRAWALMGGLFAIIAIIVVWFFIPWFTTHSHTREGQVESLEKKMKNCC